MPSRRSLPEAPRCRTTGRARRSCSWTHSTWQPDRGRGPGSLPRHVLPRPAGPGLPAGLPAGDPQYHNACHGKGLSGSCAAAGWSGEATLDIEWAYSIAPEAHIVLLAVPPAETEGVQGFPNLFKAISGEIGATPPGTVFSMSFAVTEQTFGGAAAAQTAKFDQAFKAGLAKDDNFFAAAGDSGTSNASKPHREGTVYPYPTAQWPASSPYVVAVGGTQLQDGWTWNPSSNTAFTSTGALNPAYWAWTSGGDSQAVWNESWGPIATGGGESVIYPRPSWQQGVPAYGNHRLVPDTAWNAAVNGGVDVYITAYPGYNCGNATGCWTIYGGTSAATPQTAALVALVNAARARRASGRSGSSTRSSTWTVSAPLTTPTSCRSTTDRHPGHSPGAGRGDRLGQEVGR